jgi:hypothetical protein
MKTAEAVLQLYREKYFDFNVRHFHEKLTEEHDIRISYTWVKTALQGAGLVKKQRRRGTHRRRRPRRPLPGMMLHIDASKHAWFGDGRYYDLITILDDATSEIYYAQLVAEEGTRTLLPAVRQVIQQQGIFCALYSDRASHFFVTPKAGGKVDESQVTQFGRALKELGIKMIPAYSPQARGRMERSYRTWQGRLPQELRLRQITTVEEANRFLRQRYQAEFNRFTVVAAGKGSAFVRTRRKDLDWVFSIQHERTVNPDNTIALDNRILQIEKTRWRNTLSGCKVQSTSCSTARLSSGLDRMKWRGSSRGIYRPRNPRSRRRRGLWDTTGGQLEGEGGFAPPGGSASRPPGFNAVGPEWPSLAGGASSPPQPFRRLGRCSSCFPAELYPPPR